MWKCKNCGAEVLIEYLKATMCMGRLNEQVEIVEEVERENSSDIRNIYAFCKNCGISKSAYRLEEIAVYIEK